MRKHFILMMLIIPFIAADSHAQKGSDSKDAARRICFAGDMLTKLKSETKQVKWKNQSLQLLVDSERSVVAVLMDLERDHDSKKRLFSQPRG